MAALGLIGKSPELKPAVDYLKKQIDAAKTECVYCKDADDLRAKQGEARAYDAILKDISRAVDLLDSRPDENMVGSRDGRGNAWPE